MHLSQLDLAVRVGCELIYRTEAPTAILAMFKPRQAKHQLISEERLDFDPGLMPSEFEDDHGNTVYRMMLKRGANLLRHDAIVRVPSAREDVHRVDGPVPAHELPPKVLRYTLPSRYADSDRLRDFAWQHFGAIPNGLLRVRAICGWLNKNIEYRTGSGDATISAFDVIQRGYGVCRDLAHTAIALCRTFNIPARYVTGHVPDIGCLDVGGPMDFHAYFEVYVAHCWQTFDARFLEPRIGRITIATGYDAVSCAFTTIYGGAILERFEVWAYQIDPAVVSTGDPVDISKRLDGTPVLKVPAATTSAAFRARGLG
jgi:transglutaminase-like putative cysteine protease